jgi:hypothetical protein
MGSGQIRTEWLTHTVKGASNVVTEPEGRNRARQRFNPIPHRMRLSGKPPYWSTASWKPRRA